MKENIREVMLSDKEIDKLSQKLIIKDKVSVSTILAGFCGWVIMFGSEQVFFAGAFLLMIAAGALLTVFNFLFRKSYFKRVFLEKYNKEVEIEQRQKIALLESELSSDEAKMQIDSLNKKYDHFKLILSKQLPVQSFSYQRLLGAFDKVYLIGLSKLETVLMYEGNSQVINEYQVRNDIANIERNKVLKDFEIEKLTALNQRLNLKKEYRDKIMLQISENEVALTRMDLLISSLTDLHKPKNMENALEDLSNLAVALNYEEKNAIIFK